MALRSCRLCPRRCGADRAAGRLGFCGAGGAGPRVFTWGPHHGEEPPVSGTRGSGTVFFSGCTLRCLYCQNYRWSQEGEGTDHDAAGMERILRSLHDAGCHNWNLVSPTPWLPFIAEAVRNLKEAGVSLPVVYNTSGFENIDTLRAIEGLVDVYLTDLRYAEPQTALAASGHGDYVGVAREAILEMWRQRGELREDAAGVAVSGTICRILILPGRAQEAVAGLEWLAENVGTGIALSVMSQYVPAYRAARTPGWDRAVTREEHECVSEAVEKLGFCSGWVQEYGSRSPAELVGFNMRPAV